MKVMKEGDFYSVLDESEAYPGDDQLLGVFREDPEGFFRFHPANSSVLTCKQLRKLSEEVGRLN